MNTLDIVIIGIVALFTVLGLRKGIIISLATLGGLILGIYAALHFSNLFSGLVEKAIHPGAAWLPSLSFAVTFFTVLVGVYVLGKMVEKVVDLAGMGILNHIGGALLGMTKGVILVSVFCFFLNTVDPSGKMIGLDPRKKSLFFTPVSKVFPEIMKILRVQLKHAV